MSKLSKDTQQRIVISLTSESAGKELIDAIESAGAGSGDEYALKDLSNIAGTAIPAGINLESLSTSQSALTSFKLKTKDQTDSVSGRIDIISGSAASSFSTGSVNLFSGGTGTASGAGSTTVMTGSVSLSSGGISGGTKGSTGSGNLRSGALFISTPGTAYAGNTGNVILAAGQVSCSVTGSSVTGNGGNAVVGGGGLTAVAGSVIGNSGSVSVTSGIILSNSTGSVTGNTGTARFGTGNIQGSSTTIGNTGNTELYSGPVWNLTNVGNTGSVDVYTGDNSGVGNTGNVNITTGQPFGGGSRGSIFLNGQGTQVKLRNYDVTGDHSLFVISNDSPGGYGAIQFLTYAMGNNTMGIRIFDSDPSSGFSIQGYGRLNQNGGAFNFVSTGATPDADGTYTGGDFNITAGSTGNIDPLLGLNNSISSGNVNISTANGYVSGSNTDASSGNISLITGTNQGSGSRGIISLDGEYISVSSKQVKYVADAIDDSDAVNLAQLKSKIRSGVVDISNASNIITVTFSSDIGTSNYSLSYSVLNFADISPLFLDKMTIAKSSTGFTVKFDQNTDSGNYKLEYIAQLFN